MNTIALEHWSREVGYALRAPVDVLKFKGSNQQRGYERAGVEGVKRKVDVWTKRQFRQPTKRAAQCPPSGGACSGQSPGVKNPRTSRQSLITQLSGLRRRTEKAASDVGVLATEQRLRARTPRFQPQQCVAAEPIQRLGSIVELSTGLRTVTRRRNADHQKLTYERSIDGSYAVA